MDDMKTWNFKILFKGAVMKRVKTIDFFQVSSLGGALCLSLCASVLCFLPDSALAATIGDQLSKFTTEAQSAWIPFIKVTALVIGMACFMVGLVKLLKAQNSQGGVGEGIKYMVVGVCLMAISAVSLMVGGSVAGEGAIDAGAWN